MDTDELHARVASRIREQCDRRRLDLIELARLAGVSRAHLFAVLAGQKSPTLAYLNKLATVLEIDPHMLLKPPRQPRASK